MQNSDAAQNTLLKKSIKKYKPKRQKRSLGVNIIIYTVFVIFLIYAVTLIFPFAWMLFNSVKSSREFFDNIWALPKGFRFSNYTEVLFNYRYGKMNLIGMFGVSLLTTVAGTVIAVFVSSLAAYTVAKYKFFGRNFIYALAIFVMIVPVAGTLPSQFRVMKTLQLYDSVIGVLVLYSGAFGFNFFMLYGFFKNLSWSYAEAARVDGAGHATVFFRIMIPLAKPAFIAVGIIHAINLWNDYTTPSIYLKSLTTLAVGLNVLVQQMTVKSEFPQMFATMIIALLPILAVFIAFQKTIMENTIAGGLKG